jgi:hypothetical protein
MAGRNRIANVVVARQCRVMPLGLSVADRQGQRDLAADLESLQLIGPALRITIKRNT